MKEGGLSAYLFDEGSDKIPKKVGEEVTEVIIAGKAEQKNSVSRRKRNAVFLYGDPARHWLESIRRKSDRMVSGLGEAMEYQVER